MLRAHSPLERPRGFTLLEVLTALAIVGIMAGLSISSLSGLKKRGTFVSGAGDLIEGLRLTRAEAFGRQSPCVFVIDTVNNRWWSIADVDNNFAIGSFNASTPNPSPDVLLASGTLPTGVTFGPSTGYGASLPAPYAGVTANSACSFCVTAGGNTFGSITFYGAGSAVFSANNTSIGNQFTIQAPKASGSGLQVMTFATVGRTGAVASFEASN
jgi:prepilin-type N-terminal cleavage/methylation domain-containing protein